MSIHGKLSEAPSSLAAMSGAQCSQSARLQEFAATPCLTQFLHDRNGYVVNINS